MNVLECLDLNLCVTDFAATDKPDALRKMAEIAVRSPRLSALGVEELEQALAEREAAVSTGLGDGMAIPHARLDRLDQFVAFLLIAPKGIAFDALDGAAVHLFFVIFAPATRTDEHLRLLASISRLCAQASVRESLRHAKQVNVLPEIIGQRLVAPGVATNGTAHTQKLLLIVCFYESDIEAILEYLIDQGVNGAVILEGKSMGLYVSAMPLFASFLGFMRDDMQSGQVVMTLIDAELESSLVQGIEDVTGDLDKRQGTIVICVDVSFHKGTLKMI